MAACVSSGYGYPSPNGRSKCGDYYCTICYGVESTLRPDTTVDPRRDPRWDRGSWYKPSPDDLTPPWRRPPSQDEMERHFGNAKELIDKLKINRCRPKKTMLQKLTDRLKRVLNADLRNLYRVGWIDEDLELTEAGQTQLLEMLLDKHEAELGKLAKKEVKRLEKEEEDGEDEE